MKKPLNIALILIGGSGKRMNINTPKQFLMYKDLPLYVHTIKAFSIKEIDAIYLVCQKDYEIQINLDLKKYHLHKVKGLISSGEERYLSSFNGIKYLKDHYKEEVNVLIHDGARPFTSKRIIKENIKLLKNNDAVLTAIKGEAEIERINTSHIINNEHYLAQTPQSFHLDFIYNLFNKYILDKKGLITDDIALCDIYFKDYALCLGAESNIKITTMSDFTKLK